MPEKKPDAKKKPMDGVKESATKPAPKPSAESDVKKLGKEETKPTKPMPPVSEPAPAAQTLESKPKSGSSSEAFTLMEAAPFE
jgi:hypothetical protein